MSTTTKPKKKILPRPQKRRSLDAAMAHTNKKYAATLAKLAK
jgi:hypothetical protein